MKMRKRLLMASAVSLVAVAGLGACSSDKEPAMRATEAGPTVVGEDLIQTTASVEAIDTAKRVVILRGPQGRSVPVKVGTNIDLSKIKKGDVVDIAYYQALAVSAVPAGTAAPGVTSASDAARSQKGEMPAKAMVDQTTVTARVVALDQRTHTVTFQGADGATRDVKVKNPELQQKMRGLKVGDLVQFTYTEAVAARLQPRATK